MPLVLVLAFCMAIGQLPARAHLSKVSASQWKIVRQCHAMMLPDETRAADAARAKRQFNAMSRHRLKLLLEPCLAGLPVGCGAYQGVAFVLAYYGIDVTRNVRRMMAWSPNPQIANFKDMPEAAETIYGCLETIYRRHHNSYALQRILGDESDGAGATMVRSVRLRLFRSEPETVVRVAAEKPTNLRLLARDLLYHGRKAEKTILLKMTRSRSATVRRSALACLRQMEILDQESKRWGAKVAR